MEYPTYLIHFNRNHSSKNGQFTSGDGDGDGTRNDHAHRTVDEKKMSNKGYRNASKTFDMKRSITKGTPSKGGVTNRHSPNEDRNVDDAKLSQKQYDNASKTFDMKRSINSGNVSKGSSFVNGSGVKNRKVGEVDEQKLSNSEEAKEVMRRQFGYVMTDLTEEDEEKKKKKNKKITQSHWGDNYVTGDV